jgi:hypothetical protein
MPGWTPPAPLITPATVRSSAAVQTTSSPGCAGSMQTTMPGAGATPALLCTSKGSARSAPPAKSARRRLNVAALHHAVGIHRKGVMGKNKGYKKVYCKNGWGFGEGFALPCSIPLSIFWMCLGSPGVPATYRAVLPTYRAVPATYRAVLPTYRAVPLAYPAVPLDYSAVPLAYPGVLPTYPAVLPTYPGVLPGNSGVVISSQCAALPQRRFPSVALRRIRRRYRSWLLPQQ